MTMSMAASKYLAITTGRRGDRDLTFLLARLLAQRLSSITAVSVDRPLHGIYRRDREEGAVLARRCDVCRDLPESVSTLSAKGWNVGA